MDGLGQRDLVERVVCMGLGHILHGDIFSLLRREMDATGSFLFFTFKN